MFPAGAILSNLILAASCADVLFFDSPSLRLLSLKPGLQKDRLPGLTTRPASLKPCILGQLSRDRPWNRVSAQDARRSLVTASHPEARERSFRNLVATTTH
eukprot:scaffold266_cov248-Pinguiococcus_pyrenoidosus.AAC.24